MIMHALAREAPAPGIARQLPSATAPLAPPPPPGGGQRALRTPDPLIPSYPISSPTPQHIPTHPRNPKSNFKGHLLLRDGKRISTFAPLHDIPRSPTFRLQQFGLRVRPGRPIVIPAGFNVGGVSAVLRVPGPGWPGMARDRGPRVFWISGHSLALARARGSGHGMARARMGMDGPGARAPTPPLPPVRSCPIPSVASVGFPGPGTGPGAIRGIPGPGPRAQGCHTGESRHAIKDLVNIGTAWYGRGKQARREIAARNTVRRFMFFLWRQALRYKALLRVLFSRWRLRNSALREDARGGRAGPTCSSLVCACSLVVWAPGPRTPDRPPNSGGRGKILNFTPDSPMRP